MNWVISRGILNSIPLQFLYVIPFEMAVAKKCEPNPK